MSGPCSMCQHFSLLESKNERDGLDKLRAGGWGVCAQGLDLAGFYMSQAAACQFNPSRFLGQPLVEGDGRAPARAEQPTPCDLPEEIDFG